jgi:hypothetical protein
MVTATIRPNMWIKWANIAIRAEAEALRARRAAMETGDHGYLGWENENSIAAVAAVRHAFTHLWEDWKPLIAGARGVPETALVDEVDETDLPLIATTDVPEGDARDEWLAGFAEIVRDRIRVVHLPEPAGETERHPTGVNVSPMAVHFKAERATDAVERMIDFVERVVAAPGSGLEAWAEGRQHVPPGLRETRDSPWEPFPTPEYGADTDTE